MRYNSCDINDIITNLVGRIIGYGIFNCANKLSKATTNGRNVSNEITEKPKTNYDYYEF